jgi:biotin carboxyl carrier protein
MDLRKLKTLIDLVQQSGIAELEITEGEEKVRISRFGQGAATAPLAAPQQIVMAAPLPAQETGAEGGSGTAVSAPPELPAGQIADGRHLLPVVSAGRQGLCRGRSVDQDRRHGLHYRGDEAAERD